MDALLASGTLSPQPAADRDTGYTLTGPGRELLAGLGVDCEPAAGRRPLIRGCTDWTERRHHLAGALGARLLDRFVALGWVEHRAGTRAVTVTEAGAAGLRAALGADLAA